MLHRNGARCRVPPPCRIGLGVRYQPGYHLVSIPFIVSGWECHAAGSGSQPGTEIVSTAGRYRFCYQGDGNLVLYDGRIAIWASNTAGRLPGVCNLQGDGNLVVYIPGGHPVWALNTRTAGSHLIVQDDGNVVIYTSYNQPVWATNTVTVRNLPLTEQHQQQTEWCWAATTASITCFMIHNQRGLSAHLPTRHSGKQHVAKVAVPRHAISRGTPTRR